MLIKPEEKAHAAEAMPVWPDLLAFVAGLLLAASAGWDTTGLVWSLWLSSLVVGYASLVLLVVRLVWGTSETAPKVHESTGSSWLLTFVFACGGLLLLAFFTVHFGGFHWGHSIFLGLFFPLDGSAPLSGGAMLDADDYWEIVKRCWWFLPLAFVAERAAFMPEKKHAGEMTAEESSNRFGEGMLAPYRNVVRLHLLIFFFAFAFFAGLDGIWIFIVVYAVYFFPWRILKTWKKETQPT